MAVMSYTANVEDAGVGDSEFLMKCNNHSGLFQVTFASGATGTVKLYGKMNSSHDYWELESMTASGMAEVAILPFMKITWTLVTAGAVMSVMEAM